ncbi:NYN domain-containing protein [Leekyejoonella antrihumi]|uniref:NYN domain-containing protein n=1 Tax=Leekyejoonella antrihumi TaxID=1660198 RepID=A0A563E8N7_9MICO|nr:NYN domain-containing protein [Leekyejoonella antrihumi]TWP38571.1 NYN domain-containing protein [Leekyejoonella antrihumi]
MRSYCAVYVDAGYLLAAAATRITGTSLRGGVTVDHRVLIDGIIQQVERASGLPILRVNWYDSATRGIPNAEQDAIAMLPKVKVRLGRRSFSGEQKGVDLRIGLDLSTHGRGRVVDVAYLVSGDDDLTEAVEEAQGHGVQVIVLAVPGADGRPHGVAQHLMREADGLALMDTDVIEQAVHTAQVGSRQSVTEHSETAAAAPSPAELANSHGRPTPPRPTAPAASIPHDVGTVSGPPASLVYSTHTGQPSWTEPAHLTPEAKALIDEVCRGVVATWTRTATPGERERLRKARPGIPGDLDRALLVDMSNRLGVYDIDEVTRHELRARFWEQLDIDPQT